MIPGSRSAEGQLRVVAGPPAPTDPRLGGFALTPVGEIYCVGTQSAFSPANLFLNGEQGAWYDPSDLSTMFQDSAGTIPVMADGQPVGLILDKSGRGNHASQVTSTARPLYKTDGTYHWLQFDGIDDTLSTEAIDFTNNNMSVWCGLYKISSVAQLVVETAPDAGGVSGAFYVVAGNDLGADYSSLCRSNTIRVSKWTTTTFPEKSVISVTHQINGSPSTFRKNAVNGVSGSEAMSSANFGNYQMFIGSRNSSALRLAGNIYALIVRGALSTPEEITETETWVNGKTGAY